MYDKTKICSRRYFGLARNLIWRIISPNQDDLSYSARTFFSWQQKLGKQPNTFSLAEQRHPVQTSHWRLFNSSNSMDTWGNLSNLLIPCAYLRPRNPSWIWIRYIQYATTGRTLCHPQNWLCRCDAFIPLSIHLWATLMETTHTSPQNPPDTQNSGWLQSSFPPTANMAFAKLRRTQSLACPTTRTAFSTLSYLHFVSYSQSFLRDLQHIKQTQFSMLQIKTIPKNTFRLSTLYFLNLLLYIPNKL